MTEEEFKYDVAFSFAAQDEAIAVQLNDRLSDRMKTFIYPERQRELAGTDGVVSFSDVYGREARIVVILFRKEWGSTPWTKVESGAIRQRAHDAGYDFTIFIATELNPVVPPWLPRTRLWLFLERFGIDAAAAAIEARVTEAGGLPHEETVAERAERHKRASKLKADQKQFENSEIGVRAANKAYEEFCNHLEDGCKALQGIGVAIRPQRSQNMRIVNLGKINLIISWRNRFINTLDDSVVEVEYYRGFPAGIADFFPSFHEARKLHSEEFEYKLVRTDHHTYVGRGSKREFGPNKLADHLLKLLMDHADKQSGN